MPPFFRIQFESLFLRVQLSDEVNIDMFVYKIQGYIKESTNIDVPIEASKDFQYNYDQIALDWSTLHEAANPEAGIIDS